MKSSNFSALPTELKQLIAQYTDRRKFARSMRFPLPNTFASTDEIWKLFFSSFAWLDDAYSRGRPPILVGEVLRQVRGKGFEDWKVGHVCLIYEGPMDIEEFMRSLQPHVRHTHGRHTTYDYAFEAHGITLNCSCAFVSTLGHGIYSKWPDRLSQPTYRGRQAAYLVYGEKELRDAEVLGLGTNLQSPESVSRACHFKLHNKSFLVCSESLTLFKVDPSASRLVYAEDYEERYKDILRHVIQKQDSDPSKTKCKACEMEGNETFDLLVMPYDHGSWSQPIGNVVKIIVLEKVFRRPRLASNTVHDKYKTTF